MKNETYSTNDFYLSAYLKAKGFKLANVERDGRRSTFIFEDRQDREDLIRDFYNDPFVNNFTHAIRDLKATVFTL